MSLRPARDMSLGRWLLVACFSSVKNHNVSGPHLLPNVTTHAQKSLCFPRTVLHEQKNHFAIGRNSERCYYHTDLSRFVLPISDPSALNLSQFGGFQDSPNLSKIEKVAENRDFDGKETLIVKRAIAISKRVLGWRWLSYRIMAHLKRNMNLICFRVLSFLWDYRSTSLSWLWESKIDKKVQFYFLQQGL